MHPTIQGFTKDAVEAASITEPFQKEQRQILTLARHKVIACVVVGLYLLAWRLNPVPSYSWCCLT